MCIQVTHGASSRANPTPSLAIAQESPMPRPRVRLGTRAVFPAQHIRLTRADRERDTPLLRPPVLDAQASWATPFHGRRSLAQVPFHRSRVGEQAIQKLAMALRFSADLVQ